MSKFDFSKFDFQNLIFQGLIFLSRCLSLSACLSLSFSLSVTLCPSLSLSPPCSRHHSLPLYLSNKLEGVVITIMMTMMIMMMPKGLQFFDLSAQRIGASYVVRAFKPHRSTRTLTIALTVYREQQSHVLRALSETGAHILNPNRASWRCEVGCVRRLDHFVQIDPHDQ